MVMLMIVVMVMMVVTHRLREARHTEEEGCMSPHRTILILILRPAWFNFLAVRIRFRSILDSKVYVVAHAARDEFFQHRVNAGS